MTIPDLILFTGICQLIEIRELQGLVTTAGPARGESGLDIVCGYTYTEEEGVANTSKVRDRESKLEACI